jgi:hypothetical protein
MRLGPQRRPRGQRTRPHAQSRTNWRWHCPQRTSATWAELQPRIWTGEMCTQPMPSCRTLLINALHRPAWQILHVAPPRGPQTPNVIRVAPEAAEMPDCDAGSQWCQEQTTQDIGVRLQHCGFPVKLLRQRLQPLGLTDSHRRAAKFHRTAPHIA